MKKISKWIQLLGLFILLLGCIILAVSVGSANLSAIDSLKLIVSKIPLLNGFTDVSNLSNTYETIVWKVRMPRIAMSVLVGGSLAVVGTAFQGVFRNSLADPHILGISSGAALGATIAMISGVSVSLWGLGTTGIFAFIGALITVYFVYRVARIGGEISVMNMLLLGTAISTMLSAMISLIMTFHDDQIAKIYMWTMGSFSSATWERVFFLSLFVLVAIIVLLGMAGKLNVMMTGEEDAKCLGIDTDRVRLIVIVAASLLVAACVCVSGIIGFVGLIIPHCVRLVKGANNKVVMPFSFFVGAIFLLLCDTLARTITSPTEIPVGVITAIFGAPYFIVLVLMRRKKQ